MSIGHKGRRDTVAIQDFQQSPNAVTCTVMAPRHGSAVVCPGFQGCGLHGKRWALVARPVLPQAGDDYRDPGMPRPFEARTLGHVGALSCYKISTTIDNE